MKHTKLAAFAAATALALGTASCSQQKEDVAPSRLHQVAGASDTDDDTPPDPDGDTPPDPDDSTPVEPDYDLPEGGDPSADSKIGFNATAVAGRTVKVSFTLPSKSKGTVEWSVRTTSLQGYPAAQSPGNTGAYVAGRRSLDLVFPVTGVWTITLTQADSFGRNRQVLASKDVTVIN